MQTCSPARDLPTPQEIAKFLSGWREVPLCEAGDADRKDFSRAGERAVEEAVAGHVFEDRRRQSDAASGFHFSEPSRPGVSM